MGPFRIRSFLPVNTIPEPRIVCRQGQNNLDFISATMITAHHCWLPAFGLCRLQPPQDAESALSNQLFARIACLHASNIVNIGRDGVISTKNQQRRSCTEASSIASYPWLHCQPIAVVRMITSDSQVPRHDYRAHPNMSSGGGDSRNRIGWVLTSPRWCHIA